MRVLVVEDEGKTASFLKKGLSEQGFTVEVASTGDRGLQLAQARQYDVLVVDVMLPGRDGWSLLAELRRAGVMTPALFLTARDSVDDRVRGLELGADDYLVKPFAFAELLARLRTILRRSPRSGDVVHVADLEVDLIVRRASRAGQRLDLTPKEFALLSLFIRHTGAVLGRPVIAREVWDVAHDGETNVVEVHVRRLRAKLDDPFEKKLLHTVRGAGYVLEDRL